MRRLTEGQARVRMVVADLTMRDGRTTGQVTTSVTKGGRTHTETRRIDTGSKAKPTAAQAALLRDMGDTRGVLRNDSDLQPGWFIEGGRGVRAATARAVVGNGWAVLTDRWGGVTGVQGFTRTEAGRLALAEHEGGRER